jgi:hypothetical protein
MKILSISILLTFITLHLFGQINFENGYIIDNNNKRVECLIKNTDWKNNPSEFEYKLTSDGITEKGSLSTVKEFGVTGFSKYVRADLKIDLSSYDVNKLSKTRDPEWSQEKLFLKVLVEGEAKLYYYENSGLIRFFYSTSTDTVVNQLVYKEYFEQKNKDFVEEFVISVNNKFHQQLWVNVKCPNTSAADIEKIAYRKSDLVKYFQNYNACSGNTNIVFENKKGNDSFHLKISPGLNYSYLSVINTYDQKYSTHFENQLNFRIGLEAEFLLPFNKNKWGILFEPTFQYFSNEVQKTNYNFIIDLNTIEFPIGLRHYFFLNKGIKLFADLIFIPSYGCYFNSTFERQYTTSSILPTYLEIKPSHSFAFGGGLGYKKLSAELRYYTNRNLLNNYASWYTDYQRLSLILGFTIL